ncbi:MAG TPA: hypothetical protein V6D13_04580 [Halomicronema sp.]
MKRSFFSWLVALVFSLLVAGIASPAFAVTPASPLRLDVSVKKVPVLKSLSLVRGNVLSVWVGARHSGDNLGCRCVSCLGLTGSYNLPV